MSEEQRIERWKRIHHLTEKASELRPVRRMAEVDELLVRFPRLPGAPPILYGGVVRVRIYDDDQLLESHLSPLENERGLHLDEHWEIVERALARHSARLRENLG